MIRTRGALLLAAVVVAGAALTGCSSSDDSSTASSATPTPSASMVGGMTECTEAAIKPTLEAGLAKDVELMSWDALSCADGWAVVGATVGDGEHGAPSPFIFEAEGQFWIPKQQQDVCGTVNFDVNPAPYPADALIPEALFTEGCLVG
ncbi:MAG: hypothetical protein F2923_07800 [Actinobacteria bacterium]|uniref:Unannotated protein n=1 Tax=freshwater metagenome TaxID=449393 RepID=A0A6J7SM94_9ZZZZ|nr:hypothetical protein [Actinomycetota bacterium]